jgi:hypothetical protein
MFQFLETRPKILLPIFRWKLLFLFFTFELKLRLTLFFFFFGKLRVLPAGKTGEIGKQGG